MVAQIAVEPASQYVFMNVDWSGPAEL